MHNPTQTLNMIAIGIDAKIPLTKQASERTMYTLRLRRQRQFITFDIGQDDILFRF